MNTNGQEKSGVHMPKDLIAFVDGGQDFGSKEMLSGFWISDTEGNELVNSSVVREVGTTNQAEFRAMIGLLHTLYKMVEPSSTITIYGDSQILIHFLQHKSKIKHPNLLKLASTTMLLVKGLHILGMSTKFVWTKRTGNKAADYLANVQSINNKRFKPDSKRDSDRIHARLILLKSKDLKGHHGKSK